MKYDFDQIVDRSGNHSAKYDERKKKFGTEDVIPLWIADMDFRTCQPVIDALTARAQEGLWGYTARPDSYFAAIRAWQKKRNGWEIDQSLMSYSLGVVQTISAMVKLFTPEGGSVLIQTPVYSEFYDMAEAWNRKVVENPFVEKDGKWSVDWADFEAKLQQADLFLLCNPHNPIGIAWPASVLRQVASLARKHGVIVFDDEIHSDLMLYGHKHAAFAAVSDDAAAVALTLGAPTKTFNIAGLESSWCVVKNPDLRKPFYNWLGTNELNSPTMVATLATEAAYTCGESWLEQCLHYIEANVDYVAAYCRQHLDGIVAVKPQASYLVWLDCTALGLSHEQLVSLFVDKAHLALNDGAMFGRGGEGHMRLNCATPRNNLVEAMRRLTDAI